MGSTQADPPGLPVGEIDPVVGAEWVALPQGEGRLVRMRTAWRLFALILRARPDVVVTTGEEPGVFALRVGHWFGARTVILRLPSSAS